MSCGCCKCGGVLRWCVNWWSVATALVGIIFHNQLACVHCDVAVVGKLQRVGKGGVQLIVLLNCHNLYNHVVHNVDIKCGVHAILVATNNLFANSIWQTCRKAVAICLKVKLYKCCQFDKIQVGIQIVKGIVLGSQKRVRSVFVIQVVVDVVVGVDDVVVKTALNVAVVEVYSVVVVDVCVGVLFRKGFVRNGHIKLHSKVPLFVLVALCHGIGKIQSGK